MTQNYFFGLPDDLINKIVNQNQESLEDKINELIPSLDKIDNFKQLKKLVANVYLKLQKEFIEKYSRNDIIRKYNQKHNYYEYFVIYAVKEDCLKCKLLESASRRGLFGYFQVVTDTFLKVDISDCNKYEIYSSLYNRQQQSIIIANKLKIGDKAEIQCWPNAYITRTRDYHSEMNEMYLTSATIAKITDKYIFYHSASRNMNHRAIHNYSGRCLKVSVIYKIE